VQAAAALVLAALNGYLAGGALGWWRVFGVDIGVIERWAPGCSWRSWRWSSSVTACWPRC